MPLFTINTNKLTMLNTLLLSKEKELQRLIETNLKEALDMYFLASEYMTSTGGRIDTLAVDTDGAPTISGSYLAQRVLWTRSVFCRTPAASITPRPRGAGGIDVYDNTDGASILLARFRVLGLVTKR